MRSPFELRHTAEEYLAHAATQPGTRALDAARRADALIRVRRQVAAFGWPHLIVPFVGYLTVGQLR